MPQESKLKVKLSQSKDVQPKDAKRTVQKGGKLKIMKGKGTKTLNQNILI